MVRTYRWKRVLVTGGAGFIGSNFVRFLLDSDETVGVLTLDALTYAGSLEKLQNLPRANRHVFVRGNICDQPLVERLLREYEIDTIIHFAAESHVDRSIEGPGVFVRTNVQGTFTLLEAARRYWLEERHLREDACRFHHVSTDEVYGSLGPGDPAFTETTPYAPNSPYSASKAASDHLVRAYHRTYGLPVGLTNCSNNYGPLQHPEKFIPTIICSCRNRLPIPVYGTGSNIRDWLYVDDHCRGIAASLHHGWVGESYNLGGRSERSNLEIVRSVCALMDEHLPQGAPHERLVRFVADRPGHDWRYAMDTAKAEADLGWGPLEDFEGGLRKTLAWYLERP